MAEYDISHVLAINGIPVETAVPAQPEFQDELPSSQSGSSIYFLHTVAGASPGAETSSEREVSEQAQPISEAQTSSEAQPSPGAQTSSEAESRGEPETGSHTEHSSDSETGSDAPRRACRYLDCNIVHDAWPTTGAAPTIEPCMTVCEICRMTYASSGSLRRHVKRVHGPGGTLECYSTFPPQGIRGRHRDRGVPGADRPPPGLGPQ